MSLRIRQNTDALDAYRNLSITQGQMSSSLEKLSSAFRIDRAADDVAGLVISEGPRSRVASLQVAVRNAQDGISVAQTAEGALTEVHSMLQRMNDLAVQYNNDTQDTDSQAALQSELTALSGEIDRIQNRFEHTIDNLNVAVENLSASESRIRDTDMASEMARFARAQDRSQAQLATSPTAIEQLVGTLRKAST